jgi:hypothetical protein
MPGQQERRHLGLDRISWQQRPVFGPRGQQHVQQIAGFCFAAAGEQLRSPGRDQPADRTIDAVWCTAEPAALALTARTDRGPQLSGRKVEIIATRCPAASARLI